MNQILILYSRILKPKILAKLSLQKGLLYMRKETAIHSAQKELAYVASVSLGRSGP